MKRDEGEKRLEATLAELAPQMGDLSARTREFESACLGTHDYAGSCEQLLEDLSSGVAAIGRSLEEAEDDARRSWVSPGFVRDLRQKHGVGESSWTDLAATVRRLTTRYHAGL